MPTELFLLHCKDFAARDKIWQKIKIQTKNRVRGDPKLTILQLLIHAHRRSTKKWGGEDKQHTTVVEIASDTFFAGPPVDSGALGAQKRGEKDFSSFLESHYLEPHLPDAQKFELTLLGSFWTVVNFAIFKERKIKETFSLSRAQLDSRLSETLTTSSSLFLPPKCSEKILLPL